MSAIASKLSPPITSMIRLDHTHAVSVFHQYTQYKTPRTRQALAETLCLALEIHAQLEEEIFYPAMQRVEHGEPVLEKSVPEHDEMRRLIGKLRASSPHDDGYDETVAELNQQFRNKAGPTNVLSFPSPEFARPFLGDVILAKGVCVREALEQDKPLADHVTHLVVHGVLHLRGHDHEDEGEAEAMEALERTLLAGLGVPDPYNEPR